MYKLTESVIPHQTLFQHQLGYVWPTIKHVKLFTQNVTNITFIFETSPNTKPTETKVGGHGILCPPRLKNWGGSSSCPPPNCAYVYKDMVVIEGILHYHSAQTCGFSFLSHLGCVFISPI